jgi:hypothetical protein
MFSIDYPKEFILIPLMLLIIRLQKLATINFVSAFGGINEYQRFFLLKYILVVRKLIIVITL